jgi:hypothetical protein
VSATLVPIIEYEEKLLKDGVTEKKLWQRVWVQNWIVTSTKQFLPPFSSDWLYLFDFFVPIRDHNDHDCMQSKQ